MIIRAFLVVVTAIGMVGLAIVGWIALHPAAPPVPPIHVAAAPPPPVSRVAYLAAARSLRAGTLLRPEDLKAVERDPGAAVPDAQTDTSSHRSDLIGCLVREPIADGAVIMQSSLLRPGDHGFLAAVVRPGMLAETIGVDAISSVGGLLWPGDHVDAILTQELEDKSLPNGKRLSADTVLSDVRLVAIDQQLVQGAAPGSAAQIPRTATIEIAPADAPRLAVAIKLGQISLAVRGAPSSTAISQAAAVITSTGHENGAGTVWAGDVSPALGFGQNGHAQSHLHVYEGNADGKDFQF